MANRLHHSDVAATHTVTTIANLLRQALEQRLDRHTAPLVVRGHVHQFRIVDAGAWLGVWAPSTWAVLPDRIQAPFGTKRCGLVSLTLTADGQTRASLVEPAGIKQTTLTQDIPDPYDRCAGPGLEAPQPWSGLRYGGATSGRPAGDAGTA